MIFVLIRSDRLGSGWKPLFGSLKAVRSLQLEEDRVPWTVLDVISTYLGLTKWLVTILQLTFLVNSKNRSKNEFPVLCSHHLFLIVSLASLTFFNLLSYTEQFLYRRRLKRNQQRSLKKRRVRLPQNIPISSSLSESPIDLDTQVSKATLNLIRPLFAVIINLYRTPHIPNQSLLHRYTVLPFHLSSTDYLVLNFERELFKQRRN